jgi:hypothetical protein
MQTALMAGDVAYLATGQLSTLRAGSEAFNQIVKVDANTFETRETLDTTRPFYSMSLSSDGNTIYTVSPERGIVTAVDTRNLTQIREIHLEGHWPVFAISAPR